MSVFIKKGRTFLQKIRPCLQDFFVARFRTHYINSVVKAKAAILSLKKYAKSTEEKIILYNAPNQLNNLKTTLINKFFIN
jgi:hypothetical protein